VVIGDEPLNTIKDRRRRRLLCRGADITEGIMAAIFVHADAAKQVSERVPARPKKA